MTKSLIHSWVRGRGPKMEELEDQGERENLTHSFIDTYIYIYIDIDIDIDISIYTYRYRYIYI